MKKICPLCGTENEENTRFCKECNEPLYKEEEMKDISDIKEERKEGYSKACNTKNILGKTYSSVSFFSKEWFVALWEGERPLWEAWLIIGVALVIIEYFIFSWIIMIFPNLITLLYFILIFIQIFWWVAMWRCAPNVTYKIFFYIARFFVIGYIASYINQWI